MSTRNSFGTRTEIRAGGQTVQIYSLPTLEKAGFGGSNLLSLLIFQGAFWKGWQSMITLLEVLALVTVGVVQNLPILGDNRRAETAGP